MKIFARVTRPFSQFSSRAWGWNIIKVLFSEEFIQHVYHFQYTESDRSMPGYGTNTFQLLSFQWCHQIRSGTVGKSSAVSTAQLLIVCMHSPPVNYRNVCSCLTQRYGIVKCTSTLCNATIQIMMSCITNCSQESGCTAEDESEIQFS